MGTRLVARAEDYRFSNPTPGPSPKHWGGSKSTRSVDENRPALYVAIIDVILTTEGAERLVQSEP